MLFRSAYNEYRRFLSSEENKAAIFAFTGPVFKALDAKSLTYNEFHFAQNHVRILSSIYGVLKPLDAIKEYRSTFMIKEKELPEQNLFAFWKDKITDTILKDAKQDNKEILFLAFHDLLKCLDLVEIEKETRFVTVSFKEIKNGEAKIVREYEKIAIGHLLSHIIKNNINNIEDIKSWEYDEYKFNVNLSDNLNIVFSRETK